MKKVMLVGLAVVSLVASLALGTVASADSGEDGSVQAAGRGRLTAQGDGIAALGGRGVVDVTGNGVLWVKDLGGSAVIEVTGYGEMEEFEDGWVQYAGFHGDAHIEGGRIIVALAGVDIDLAAAGRGRVILWGHGTYELNGQSGDWNSGLGTRMRLAGPNETAGVQAAPFAE